MSLRIRLFLLLGGLVALLAAVQWWWIRGLTGDLYDEVDEVAVTVGRSVASIIVASAQEDKGETPFAHHSLTGCETDPCTDHPPRVEFYRWKKGQEENAEDSPSLPTHHKVKVVYPGNSQDIGMIPVPPGTAFHIKPHEATPQTIVVQTPSVEETTEEEGAAAGQRIVLQTRSREESDGDEVHVEEIDFRHHGDLEVEAQFDSLHGLLHLEHKGEARFLRLPGHRLPIPQEGMKQKLEHFSRQMLLGTLAFLVIGLALAGFVAHRVSTPLSQLSAAAHDVGEGALGTRAPVPTSGGEVAHAITAFNEMSERLAVLDAKTRELRTNQHLGEIGEIARGLAHTLRNPLNALGLSVEELAARATAEESDHSSHDLADSARRQIRRIDHSIRSFLALASQGGGVMGPVQVASLVQDVALEALQDAQGKVRLELEGMETPSSLHAVEPELRAVVQALLVNAIEASPSGAAVTVRLAETPGSRLQLEIEDEGPGLSDEVRARLFTPHLTTKANGSGMGLFLAHRIATNRYTGSLELHDRTEGGTRAVLEIGERTQGAEA